jgi:gamma-glutamyltranspeptidase/glutathione hydrolase
MVSAVDVLATQAGVRALRLGGSAVDAAIAANAVLGVTLPNQCGLGGDLFAIVQRTGEQPQVLTAAGRAGSGADAGQLRDEGHRVMPREHDMRSVTVPGCLDGWLALHARLGRLDFPVLLEDATRYAVEGFPVSAYFAGPLRRRAGAERSVQADGPLTAVQAGDPIRRPGLARVLAAIADGGRSGFYLGEFGATLVQLGDGQFVEDDLRIDQAQWTAPLSLDVWGRRLWTPAPPSQGYLTLSAAWLAQRAGLDSEPDDPAWAHLLIEAMRQAAVDRPAALFDGADGHALLDPARLQPRAGRIRRDSVADLSDSYRDGGTTFLSAVDEEGTAVALIQSNCMSFGSGIVAGDTGIWLHNRGIGFNLEPGHPAEYAAARRPCSRTIAANSTRPWARVAATHSRRSCCNCWRGCSWRGSTRPRRSRLAAGCCGVTPTRHRSTPGGLRAGSGSRWRDTRRRPGRARWANSGTRSVSRHRSGTRSATRRSSDAPRRD